MLEEEKTDSESSCLLFERESGYPKEWNYVCEKICLEIFHQPRKGSTQDENYIFIPFLRFFPSPSGRSGQNDEEGFIICGAKGWIRTTRLILVDK